MKTYGRQKRRRSNENGLITRKLCSYSMPISMLPKLQEYADENFRGNKSAAVAVALAQLFESDKPIDRSIYLS